MEQKNFRKKIEKYDPLFNAFMFFLKNKNLQKPHYYYGNKDYRRNYSVP